MKPFLITEHLIIHDTRRAREECGLDSAVSKEAMTGLELMYEIGRHSRRWFMPAQGRPRVSAQEFCRHCWPDHIGD